MDGNCYSSKHTHVHTQHPSTSSPVGFKSIFSFLIPWEGRRPLPKRITQEIPNQQWIPQHGWFPSCFWSLEPHHDHAAFQRSPEVAMVLVLITKAKCKNFDRAYVIVLQSLCKPVRARPWASQCEAGVLWSISVSLFRMATIKIAGVAIHDIDYTWLHILK